MMNTFDFLSIPLDEYTEEEISRVADDEYSAILDYNPVFFFGKIIDDSFMLDISPIDESKFYALCPSCGKLIELDKKPTEGFGTSCPVCHTEGILYDYRDPDSSVGADTVLCYGHLEKLDKGYVLRLFDVELDYSDRDCNDYTTLSCYPYLLIKEVYREYWYAGETKYYENTAASFFDAPTFKPVSTVDDSEYVIINYSNEFCDIGSERIEDILYDNPIAKTFIETVSKRGTYRTFNTLNKYGFDQLTFDFLYVPHIFGDSKKIFEVLKLDYNKVVSVMSASDVCAEDILAMRELDEYGLALTQKNVGIMRVLSKKFPCVYNRENVKKTFKYLRNQMSRTASTLVANDYFDYISDCRKLGLDTDSGEIRYPTDLGKAHERMTALVKLEANRATDERIRAAYDRFHKYCEFGDGVYCIVMPSDSAEIIREGKAQSHCVGTYCERMAKGEDIILFLRKIAEPTKPFYTLEIRPSMKRFELVQCRGLRNASASDEVNTFLSKYAEWFNRRKCDENPSLFGKYYKAVRKCPDGKYLSCWDNKTEYRIGEVIEACTDSDPDKVAVQGIHIASLEFAKRYGAERDNAAILEIEVNLRDVVVPNAKDQLRTRRGKVLREVPQSELGEVTE